MSDEDGRGDGNDLPPPGEDEDGFALIEELSDEDLEELAGRDAADAGSPDGLELDDVQSVEIRNIFLTTLPQYLEPVEEMLEQLLSTDPPDEQVRATLVKTLESIHTAAVRIGIDDVSIRIDRMCDRLAQLAGDLRPVADLGAELTATLGELRELSVAAGAEPELRPEGGDAEGARTLFAALSEAGDVDRSALERFTAAGLVTVDQLRIASLDELMAVTGLDEATVREVVGAVAPDARSAAAAPPAPADEAAPPAPAAEAAPPAPAAEEGPSLPAAEPATPEEDLARRLRETVELEASIDELRSRIQTARAAARRSREELAMLGTRRTELKGELASAEEATLETLAEVGRARTHRARLAEQLASLERERRRLDAALAALRRDNRSARREEARYADELAALTAHVQRLLDSVPSD